MSHSQNDRKGRVWAATLVTLCLLGAGPAQAQGQNPRAGRAESRLVLKLGGGQEKWLLNRMGGRPYPEFLLQRLEAGAWKVHPAEEFTRGAGQVVIPILQPGTYRVVAAASPYELYESQAVEVRAGDKQVMTTLGASSPPIACDILVLSSRTGRSVEGATFALSGPYSSLPPVRAVTDAGGRLRLSKVRTSELHLELEHGGSEPLAWQSAQECLKSGKVELTVP